MNSAVLMGSALLIFALGYRFFARFLSILVFKPAYRIFAEANTKASLSQRLISVPFDQWQYVAHHIAATVGIVSIIGAGIAATWGWAPAFLWIVTATVVAGGTYAIGALWVSRYRPDTGAVEAIIDLLGNRAAAGLMALAFLLLLFLNPLLAISITTILENYPAVALPYLLHMLIGIGMAYLLRRPSLAIRLGSSVTLIVLLCLLIWAGTKVPLVIDGAIEFEIAGYGFASIQNSVIWIVIVLLTVYATTLHSPTSGSLPRAFTIALMLALLILVMIAAIFITQHQLVAPAYASNPALPFPVPLLFITITGGAVCGFYALLAGGGSTMPAAMNHYRAGSTAYGGAIIEAILAVGALVIATSEFTSETAWLAQHNEWPSIRPLGEWIFQFINGYAGLAEKLFIPGEFAAAFCAFVLANLALAALETGIRIQCFMFEEIARAIPSIRINNRRQTKIVVVVVALLAIVLSMDSNPISIWVSFGVVNQFFACTILLVILIALLKLDRSSLVVSVPLAILFPLTLWGILERLVTWWQNGHYGAMLIGLIVMTTGCWVVALVGRVVLAEFRSGRQRDETLN